MSMNQHRLSWPWPFRAFGRSSSPPRMDEKVNPAFASVTIFNDVPQPHTMPRNYKNYADEGYAANDSVYKCVRYITENGSTIPPKLYTDHTMQAEIKSHPLLDRLAHPNNEQDGVTFREAVLGWYLIAGNAFIYAIRGGGNGGMGGAMRTQGPPDELWSLDPNKVHPEPHPTRGVQSYLYDDFDETRNRIPASNIGHFRSWNPKDAIFGLSPIEVGALMIDQQNAARKWNLALLQNAAKPSGAWVTDTPLAKNERDRLEERINEKLSGARNAGRVPVLDAGAKWTPTSLPPSELDWMESLRYNAGQIANLYNIPPQLIGDTSATTYNNMEQAKAASYTEAIFPALDKFYSLLTMWLVPMYPDLSDGKGAPTACLYYDKTTVEVVQQVIQDRETAKADRAVKAYLAGAITLNQAQEMQGLPVLGPKGDVYRIGNVLVPAEKLEDYAEQSLAEPAAPPLPQAEPLPPGTAADSPPSSPPSTPPPPAKKQRRPLRARQRKTSASRDDGDGAVFLLWECQPTACDDCLDNDGVIVADGELFPNGASSPEDCHPHCMCVASQVSLPDFAWDEIIPGAATLAGVALGASVLGDDEGAFDGDLSDSDVTLPNGDPLPDGTTLTDEGVQLPDGTLITEDGVTLPSGARLDIDGTVRSPSGRALASQSAATRRLLSPADIAALSAFAFGSIVSNHDREKQQQQHTADGENDNDDDESESKTRKRQQRQTYRRLMEALT